MAEDVSKLLWEQAVQDENYELAARIAGETVVRAEADPDLSGQIETWRQTTVDRTRLELNRSHAYDDLTSEPF